MCGGLWGRAIKPVLAEVTDSDLPSRIRTCMIDTGLEGKIVFVTGAKQPVWHCCRAVCQTFIAEGANIFVHYGGHRL